jgi:hypothetical protein
MITLRRLPTAALAFVSWVGPAPAQQVLSLEAAPEAGHITFIATIARPEDCHTLAPEPGGDWHWWGSRRPDRPATMPRLESSPAWVAPAYPEFSFPGDAVEDAENDGVISLDPLVFIGRAPAETKTLDLTLRYPTGPDSWSSLPVQLDLTSAKTLDVTDPTRFERAKAAWFRLLAHQSPDPGGFYAFAEQQTRRRAGLGTRAEPAQAAWDRPRADPYALATGAIAIQEALQLDRMTNPPAGTPAPTIPIADIVPVTIASHPYDEMRAGAEPVDTPLSRLIPEDQWFIRFGSIAKALELADFGDRWGSSLLRLTSATGQDFGVRQRLITQLCLTDGPVARALGPAVIGEVAFTGSDAYLRLGSDVTALFAISNRALFLAAMEPFVQQALAQGAVRDTTTLDGLAVERIRTPDRRISCHRAWVPASDGKEVCIYSNSEEAVRRIASAAAGRSPSLADAPDFRFIRATVFPHSAQAEDGMVFLSDAFVRRAVSPAVRIAQLRRLHALASLKIIASSQMLYGWDRGPSRPSLADLESGGYLTPSDLVDPSGGDFTLDATTGIGASSNWGTMRFMRPLVEVPIATATEAERDAYDAFRNQYQSYWQRFIDPVAIRIGVGPTITLETHILPLIDLSEYQSIKDWAGGTPIKADPASFSDQTLLRFIARIGDGQARRSALTWLGAFSGTNAAADWLGDWMTFWIEDSGTLAAIVRDAYGQDGGGPDGFVDIFRASLVAGINVKNKLSLATFLVGLRAVIDGTAPDTVVYSNLEPHGGITIVKISPNPAGPIADELRRDAQAGDAPIDPALYYATIGDGFYLATQEASLKRLIDKQAGPQAGEAASQPADQANLFLYTAPGAAAGARPAISTILEAQARRAGLTNLALTELLGRCALLENRTLSEAAPIFLGFRLVDPDGGDYTFDASQGIAASSIHGTLWQKSPPPGPLPEGSPLADLLDQLQTVSAALRFTEDGLETTVRIRRD